MNEGVIYYKHINTSKEEIKLQASIMYESKNSFKATTRIYKGFKVIISVIEVLDNSDPNNAKVKFIKDLGIKQLNCSTKLNRNNLDAAVKEINNNMISYLDELVSMNLLIKDNNVYNPILD